MTRRRGGGVKGERPIWPVISSLSALHSLEHSERFMKLYREEKRRQGIEVTRRRRGRVKKGESNLASNQFPKCSPQSGTPR